MITSAIRVIAFFSLAIGAFSCGRNEHPADAGIEADGDEPGISEACEGLGTPNGARNIEGREDPLTYRFWGWTAAQESEMRDYLDWVQPEIMEVYGPPAFANEIVIANAPSSDFSGLYEPGCNRIRVSNSPTLDTLLHETIHAYRDDYGLMPSWEEGSARLLESQLYQILYERYPDRRADIENIFTETQIGEYLNGAMYDFNNQVDLAGQSQLTFAGVRGLRSYNRTAQVLAKILVEEPTFLRELNQALYTATDVNYFSDFALFGVLTENFTNLNIEGSPFSSWLDYQYPLVEDILEEGPKIYGEYSLPLYRDSVTMSFFAWYTQITSPFPYYEFNESAYQGSLQINFYNYQNEFITSQWLTFDAEGTTGSQTFPLGSLEPQRIRIELDYRGVLRNFYYPYGILYEAGQLGGIIFGADSGRVVIETSLGFLQEVPVERGLFLTSSEPDNCVIYYHFEAEDGTFSDYVRNKAWPSYYAILDHAGTEE